MMDTIPLLEAGQILSLSSQAADRLLTHDHGDASLLYFHLLRHNNPFPKNWNLSRIKHAQAVLFSLGLLPPEFQGELQLPDHIPKEINVIPPEYTTADLNLACEENEFRQLTQSVEQQMGKTLKTPDLKMLLEIYEHLALPPQVILMVVTTCMKRQAQAKTTRPLPSFLQIKKEAKVWQNKGIVTLEQALQYTEELGKISQQQATIVQCFQLKSEEFTEKMMNYIRQWNEWGYSLDTYPMAYERCLDGIGEFSWAYVDGIFKKWHERGIHTVQEIAQGDSHFKATKNLRRSPKAQHAQATTQMEEGDKPTAEQAQRMKENFEAMKRMKDLF